MSDAPQKSYEHILYRAQMVWFSTAERWSRSWVNGNSNKSIKLGQEVYFFPVWFAKSKHSRERKSFFGWSAALSSHDCWGSRPPPPLKWDSTVFVSHSPAWWHLWLWWDDTPASRLRNSPHTSPAARRKGCRCAPPLSGTPAPPPPASQWSCRSCDSTLLQTSTLWIRKYNFGILCLNSILNNLVTVTLVHVHRNLNPAAIRHGVSCYH